MTRLQEAIAEAERFLKKARAQQKFLDKLAKDTNRHTPDYYGEYKTLNASTKRAALDLSKALPPLQRP